MYFKIYIIAQLLFVKVIIAQYQLQDLYNQNVPNHFRNVQQPIRRCSRQTTSLPSNMAVNSNLAINDPSIGNPAWQNIRCNVAANDVLQNVNNLPLNLPNTQINNLANNGQLPNINGINGNILPNVNNFGGNGFLNPNNMPYWNGLPISNQMPLNNIISNYNNGPVNNGMPNMNNINMNNFPRGGAFLNSNSFSNGNLLPNMNSNFPGNNLLPSANNILMPNGNPNFSQNNLPFDNGLLNSFNLPSNNGGSNFNNYPINNISPSSPNNMAIGNIPTGNINNPFTINSNMPLHTIVPSLNNIPGNAINNGVPYLNTARNSNPYLNEGLSAGNGMPMRGLPSNNLSMNNLQYDLANLAGKQNIMQNIIPSLSSFQPDSHIISANTMNLANALQMDSFGNLPMTNLPDTVANFNTLCI